MVGPIRLHFFLCIRLCTERLRQRICKIRSGQFCKGTSFFIGRMRRPGHASRVTHRLFAEEVFRANGETPALLYGCSGSRRSEKSTRGSNCGGERYAPPPKCVHEAAFDYNKLYTVVLICGELSFHLYKCMSSLLAKRKTPLSSSAFAPHREAVDHLLSPARSPQNFSFLALLPTRRPTRIRDGAQTVARKKERKGAK